MGLRGTNVDKLRRTIYKNGFVRHNRFEVSFSPNIDGVSNRYNVPVFAVKLPGWDTTTATETNVAGPGDWGSPKIMPIRKNWNQSLFITFYMEQGISGSMFDIMSDCNNAVVSGSGPRQYYNDRIFGSSMTVTVGENAKKMRWTFEEVWPRVLYPIDLKPVEDFAPFIFSVQFVYRYFKAR